MGCEEHELAQLMYCQKCDIFVCDSCHMESDPGHYHYLFLGKPRNLEEQMEAKHSVSPKDEIKAFKKDKNERIREQALEIINRGGIDVDNEE